MQQQTKRVFEYGKDENGLGQVLFAWSQDYNFIAVCGENRNVYVLDKRGKKQRNISLSQPGKVIQIEWDKDSEYLLILQDNLSFVSLWNVFSSNQLQEFESDNPKYKVTFAKWSKTHPVLAIGTDKGSLVFYNKKNQKKIPTMGKHAKKIISGDWNKEGYLITGGEDKILTVSNYNSDTVFDSVSVKAEPKLLRWFRQKTEDRGKAQNTILSVLMQKTLLMYELNQQKRQPLELVFEPKYGKIVDYTVFSDGYIIVGFTEGYVAHISTLQKEMQNEIQSERIFSTAIDQLCTNDILYKLAVAGQNQIKFFNLSNWKEIKSDRIDLPKNAGRVVQMEWANNGQLLVVSTDTGDVYGYLTSVPVLTAEYGQYIAILTSFTEVTIKDLSLDEQNNVVAHVNLENEPGILAIGPTYIATGMNNNVWYYTWSADAQSKGQLIKKKDYIVSIKQILLNSNWVALYTDGKCIIHPLGAADNNEMQKKFPETDNEKLIVHMGLTENFLIMLDAGGKIKFFHLQEFQLIIEFQSDCMLNKIYPNFSGTKLVCIDNNGLGYLFLANTEQLIKIEEFPSKVQSIIWDNQDPTVYIAIESQNVYTFTIIRNSLIGPTTEPVRELLTIEDINKQNLPIVTTILDKGLKPLILNNGYLSYFSATGQISGQYLGSHSYLFNWKATDNIDGHYRFFLQNLMLQRYSYSLLAASILNNTLLFETLGKKCLEHLEFDVAFRAFQSAQNLSMVLTIQSFKDETEKNILLGHVAMILGQYDLAQELFLKSSKPLLALDMRCDIQDWLIALNLAKNIAPEQEPLICKRLAIQIESQSNQHEAKKLYEKALLPQDSTILERKLLEIHNVQCYAGIARTSIKMGDVQRGFNIANDRLNDLQLIIDVAMVCENMKQYHEAAQLYEKGKMHEKAAFLYINLKMLPQAMKILEITKPPKILIQLAKCYESEGNFKEAEKAYTQAEDWENVIKLNLNYLDDIEKAKAILRNKCPTSTSATMLANYCEKKGTKKETIEFLILAGKKEEAFVLAQSHNEMEAFVEHMEKQKEVSQDDRMKIAQYYEGKQQQGLAAQQYEKAGNYQKALKLYQQAGEKYIEDAINMIGRAKNENLTRSLLDFITGEEGNQSLDPKYIYKIYKNLEKYKEAAKIALTIASNEQEQGNYKATQQFLLEALNDMKVNKKAYPFDLMQKLMIIHSYIIVKRVIKINEHGDAAQLLNRVCRNIKQFPVHNVNILTSAVIEAIRANLKYVAFQWSCVLVTEFRPQIPEKYKTKIENIARRPVQAEGNEVKTPCPFCQELIEEYNLDCTACQNNIPFCIASGKHITSKDCCFCPKCNFPANYQYFLKMLESENNCPMCYTELSSSDIQIDKDPVQKLKLMKAQELKDDPSDTKDTSNVSADSTQMVSSKLGDILNQFN